MLTYIVFLSIKKTYETKYAIAIIKTIIQKEASNFIKFTFLFKIENYLLNI